MGEAIRQSGARSTRFRGEFLESPRMGGPRVHQSQGPADQGIVQSCQPADVVGRELVHVQPDDFDEHQFR